MAELPTALEYGFYMPYRQSGITCNLYIPEMGGMGAVETMKYHV